jgi:hypothetical protein
MLSILFAIALLIVGANILRRPQVFWQKAVLVLAVITLLSVCVAWGIEYLLASA